MKIFRSNVIVALFVTGLLFTLTLPAEAARMKKVNGYPSKPINMVIAYGVGGGADTFTRMLAPFVTRNVRIPVNVLNVTGAGGENAVMHVASQPADGYTLLLAALDHAQHEAYRKVKHPMLEDFTLVCNLVEEYYGIWVRNDSPYKTLEDLIKYAKSHPGEVKIAGHSAGGTTEISTYQFQHVTGTKLNYIPFGTSKANASLLGGHADITFQKTAPMLSLIKAKKIRGLAVGGAKRTLPDVPTFRELGYKIDLPVWRGIAVRKGTPPEIVEYLQEAFKRAIADPTYEVIAKTNYFSLQYSKTKEFEAFFKSQREEYRELFKAIGWGVKKSKKK